MRLPPTFMAVRRTSRAYTCRPRRGSGRATEHLSRGRLKRGHMADMDKIGAAGTPPVRDVPVDWEALEDAFENNAPEVHSYLHIGTGEVLRVVDGIADPEMHARIASEPEYLRVDPVSSREQYRWMERFIPMVEEGELRERLTHAIDGKGAFRRFKDVLMGYGSERERWFAFRSERLRVFMDQWLGNHGLRPVARQVWPAEPAAAKTGAPISQDQLSGRRGRSAESLRRQLREIAEALGARDLEKVTAFAEFIKARRAARTYASRQEQHASGPDSEADIDEHDSEETNDEGTPPSRRAASR
jgi:hypothetical protein